MILARVSSGSSGLLYSTCWHIRRGGSSFFDCDLMGEILVSRRRSSSLSIHRFFFLLMITSSGSAHPARNLFSMFSTVLAILYILQNPCSVSRGIAFLSLTVGVVGPLLGRS